MWKTFGLWASLWLGAGCVADAEEAQLEDETGATEQAVSWSSLQWHSCTSWHCGVSLGPSTDRTCFLAGLRGKLASGTGLYPAGANVVDNGGLGWHVWIENPNFENIEVMTLCIPNTANRVTANWTTGTAATAIPPGPSATRRCFLSGVWNYSSTAFSTLPSFAHVWRDGDYHFIGGTMPAGSNAAVLATCVDVPTYQGEWEYGNWGSSTVTDNLSYNPIANGIACGLTGIGGQLTTKNPERGAYINYDSSTRYWNWTVLPGANVSAMCVQ